MFVPVRSRLFLIIRLRGVKNLGWLVQASRSSVVIVKRVYYGGGSGVRWNIFRRGFGTRKRPAGYSVVGT
jgi:hypothetical protein